MTKYEKAERHLLSGKPLSALQALNRYGIFRLAVVVNRARKKGHKVVTEMVTTKSSTYARYQLAK